MSLFDTFVPDPLLHCPVCQSALTDWQSHDGPCGLMVWRQGFASPIDQLIDGDARLPPDELVRLRLPDTFRITTRCCSPRFWVEAICRSASGVWSTCEVVTVQNARQHKDERREDFGARLRWLRGDSA
jgi:hypothetical protein